MRLRIAVVAFAALGGVALISTAASAMPNGIPNANEMVGQTSNIQQARWVSGPRGHRVWRGGPRRFVAVGPRRFAAVGPRSAWGPGWRSARAWAVRPAWRQPAWRSANAWSTGPVWGAQPAWGSSFAWSSGPAWGARPGWGWNSGPGWGWNNSPGWGW